MEEASYALADKNGLLLLFTFGAIAVAFVLILVFDSLRRMGRRRGDRTSRAYRDLNPLTRIFKRMQHNVDGLKEELRNRARHKERMRDRRH